jgi:transcription elongation factor GreB
MSNYLTPEGARKLADELRELMSVTRPKIVSEVAEAAAHGDRSENAEYIYGKKRLREIDRRVRFLTKRLESAVVVDPKEQARGASESGAEAVVRFGATVEVATEEGDRRSYRLVGADEADAARGRVSFASPIGKALLKRRVGDVVVVDRPAGQLELEILSVRYTED